MQMILQLIVGNSSCPHFQLFAAAVLDLIFQLRFLTSEKTAGGERLLITLPVAGTCVKRPRFTCQDITGSPAEGRLDPMGVFFIKGWTRSICALTVMAACRDCKDLYEAWLVACLNH